MCSPIAAGVAMGGMQMFAGISQARAAHKAAQQAAARRNAIAQQEYQNQIRIRQYQDEAKKRQHATNMEAYEKALQANFASKNMNQLEANRAQSASALRQRGETAKQAFEHQQNMASMIQTQGAILSTGGSGQSFSLLADDAERVLGYQRAEIDQTLFNQGQQFAIERQGITLDQYSADAVAYNRLPSHPQSERASLLPYKPIMEKGPSSGQYNAAVIGAVAGGIESGYSFGSSLKGTKQGWRGFD